MTSESLLLFCLALAIVAALYAAVGQAGGSGFIALMALFAFPPTEIKPTGLALNLLVSSMVTLRFAKAGHVSASLLWPFLVGSAPTAFLGGYLSLPAAAFSGLLALLLLIASVPLLTNRSGWHDAPIRYPNRLQAMATGAAIGLVSGLTGMGGGILLVPALLYFRWTNIHTAAGLSSAFILFNSALALAGHGLSGISLPALWPIYALVAVAGGICGAAIGIKRLSALTMQRILGAILFAAAIRLLLVLW